MRKLIVSERGGVLAIVLGFVIVLSIIIVPLVMSTQVGQLQANASGISEKAYTKARSAMTIFGGMYDDLKNGGKYTNDDVDKLIANFHNFIDDQLDTETKSVKDSEGNIIGVTFYAEGVSGNQKRSKLLRMNLSKAPSEIEPPPTSGSANSVFIGESKTIFDQLFTKCTPDGNPISGNIIGHDKTVVQTLFDPLAKFYLDTLFSSEAGKKLADAQALATAGGETKVINQPGMGLSQTGKIMIQPQDSNANFIISAYGNGNALEATSDLQIARTKTMNIQGNTLVGGNMIVGEVQSELVFDRNVIVKGELSLQSVVKKLYVKGNLVVNGNLTFANTANIVVDGDLVIGGDLKGSNVLEHLQVNGSLYLRGNMVMENTSKFTIGKDWITQGSLTFVNVVNGINVGGTWITNGNVTMANTNSGTITVGKDLITMSNWTMQNVLMKGIVVPNGNFVVFGKAYMMEVRKGSLVGGFFVLGGFDMKDYMQWQSKLICVI